MGCCRSVYQLCIFMGFYLFQIAFSTTVVPLCGDGDTADNCTTALAHSQPSSRVAPVQVKCRPEMQSYCFHGECKYLEEADIHYCQCDKGYTGARCVHSDLVIQPMSREHVVLIVVLVVSFLILLIIVCLSYFAYKRYNAKRCKQPRKEYKEVSTVNV
ncbi:proepiregulin [Microcaecilia unicolor]|uniref:Proepiregulin n=1 Tax=Microcaecilia unicolor TaxID=1415580 RepID=A0A6P7WYN2_9AMPH|nr:proepiregulin [Microcaecilia unicolor]